MQKRIEGQFFINKIIMENGRSKRKNPSLAWIDHEKVFDSVPQEEILKVPNILKLSLVITTFLKYTMES